MKNMLKIAVTGVHGSGKTTHINKLEKNYLKSGMRVYVVREVARKCPHDLGTVKAQEYIFHEQMLQEKFAIKQEVDVVLFDRAILDNLMYYRDIVDTNFMAGDRWWTLYDQALEWMLTYAQVIRLPLNIEWLQAEDPIGSKDVVYARRIDALFDRFVQPYVTDYTE
jgi:tRNA uridine 5-carbamoylmethylation protein Kti12